MPHKINLRKKIDLRKTVMELEQLLKTHEKKLKVACIRIGAANAANTLENYLYTLEVNIKNENLEDAAFRKFVSTWLTSTKDSLSALRELSEEEALILFDHF